MGWDETCLLGDIAEEFAEFADMSREELRSKLAADKQADNIREKQRNLRSKTRAIVKRTCVACGATFDDVVNRQGTSRKYCSRACKVSTRNRAYKARLAEKKQAFSATLRAIDTDLVLAARGWATLLSTDTGLLDIGVFQVEG